MRVCWGLFQRTGCLVGGVPLWICLDPLVTWLAHWGVYCACARTDSENRIFRWWHVCPSVSTHDPKCNGLRSQLEYKLSHFGEGAVPLALYIGVSQMKVSRVGVWHPCQVGVEILTPGWANWPVCDLALWWAKIGSTSYMVGSSRGSLCMRPYWQWEWNLQVMTRLQECTHSRPRVPWTTESTWLQIVLLWWRGSLGSPVHMSVVDKGEPFWGMAPVPGELGDSNAWMSQLTCLSPCRVMSEDWITYNCVIISWEPNMFSFVFCSTNSDQDWKVDFQIITLM